MKAFLKNYRQSPRKVRLVADLVKGKRVNHALALLALNSKRANAPIAKLISSAAANAQHNGNTGDKELFIKDLRVDDGIVMKRAMPRARGSAFQILKRTSHITVELAEYRPKVVKAKAASKKAK